MESDPESVHTNEVRQKKLSRAKQKLEAPEKLREDQRKWHQKHRLVDTEKKNNVQCNFHMLLLPKKPL